MHNRHGRPKHPLATALSMAAVGLATPVAAQTVSPAGTLPPVNTVSPTLPPLSVGQALVASRAADGNSRWQFNMVPPTEQTDLLHRSYDVSGFSVGYGSSRIRGFLGEVNFSGPNRPKDSSVSGVSVNRGPLELVGGPRGVVAGFHIRF